MRRPARKNCECVQARDAPATEIAIGISASKKLHAAISVLYALLRLKNKGGMDVQTGFLTTVPRYAINVFLVSTAVAQRCFGLLKGARAFHALAVVPVCVLFFILFSKVGESLVPWFKSGGD